MKASSIVIRIAKIKKILEGQVMVDFLHEHSAKVLKQDLADIGVRIGKANYSKDHLVKFIMWEEYAKNGYINTEEK